MVGEKLGGVLKSASWSESPSLEGTFPPSRGSEPDATNSHEGLSVFLIYFWSFCVSPPPLAVPMASLPCKKKKAKAFFTSCSQKVVNNGEVEGERK